MGTAYETEKNSFYYFENESMTEGQPMDTVVIEYEKGKVNHCAAIGIGVKGYYL